MAKRSPNPRALQPLLKYAVYGTPDLTASGGLRSLAPPSGFPDAGSGPHFLKVRCLFCGDESRKDVAIYALAPDVQGCTQRAGPRTLSLTRMCHPTCPNPAHVIKKCAVPECHNLGSIELWEAAGSFNQTRRVHFLTVESTGYEIVEYTAGQSWEATTPSGKIVPVSFIKGRFRGSAGAGLEITIPTVFDVILMDE